MSDDFARILDQTSKYGLRLILSHQHLSQLRRYGEHILMSVMTNARTKAVFGGLSYADAETLVRDVFPGDNINLQEWKSKLTRPAVVRYVRTWFKSLAESIGQNWGASSGHQKGTGGARGTNTSTTFAAGSGVNQEILNTMADSFVSSYFDSVSDTYNQTDSFTRMQGMSEGLEPVIEDMPFKEYSLQEQIHRKVGQMVQQPQRHAIIKLPSRNPNFVVVPWVEEARVTKPKVEAVKQQCFVNSQIAKTASQITQEIEARKRKLLALAKAPLKPQKEDPKTYREPAKAERPKQPETDPDKFRS